MFADAHHNLGLIYSQQNLADLAIKEFTASLRLSPDRTQTHLEMAKIFVKMGQREEARKHLTIVLSATPQDPTARQLLQMIGS